jgi:A/G-specific adenine glycosylase
VNDALLEWYAEHRGELPVRRTPDPHATLVSEAMREQTQVAPVVAWYKGGPPGR